MIELFISLSAGLISFLSPCVLPLIPGYIAYISGSSLNELLEKKNINLLPVVFFTFGFSIVFDDIFTIFGCFPACIHPAKAQEGLLCAR